MAFKMKGFPKQTGVAGVKAEQDLASELKEGSVRSNDPDQINYEIDDIKEKAADERRSLNTQEKRRIAALEKKIDTIRKRDK